MTSIKIYKYILIFLFVIDNFNFYSNNRDTTVSIYWRDGSKKTESIYKLKRTQDKMGKTIIILKKLKDVKYFKPDCDGQVDKDWSEFGECEVSKEDFEFSFAIYNKIDSLNEIRRKTKRTKRNVIQFYIGDKDSRPFFPLNINIGDTNIYSYKKQDTLIQGKIYPYQVFVKDTLSGSSDLQFLTALRADNFQIYYFNRETQHDDLKADIHAITKEIGGNVLNTIGIFMQCLYNTTDSLSNVTKSGASKGIGFVLTNLILLQK